MGGRTIKERRDNGVEKFVGGGNMIGEHQGGGLLSEEPQVGWQNIEEEPWVGERVGGGHKCRREGNRVTKLRTAGAGGFRGRESGKRDGGYDKEWRRPWVE